MKIGIGYAAWITKDSLLDFAVKTLESITSEEHELVFCGFRNSPMPQHYIEALDRFGHTHENNENNVSRAWNRSIHHLLAEGCRYVFVPNLDILLQPGALDELVAAAGRYPEPVLWTMANWHYLEDDGVNPGIRHAPKHDHTQPYPHFSAFMVDQRLFEEVGPFDEDLKPAYNEDIDMHWRIRLAGHDAVQYEGARFYHHGSRAIMEDQALAGRNNVTHAANNAYFVEKWGYKPPTADDAFTKDMFRHPYNDPSRDGLERRFMETW